MKSRNVSKGSDENLWTKREFLKLCGGGLCAFFAAPLLGFPQSLKAEAPTKGLIKTKLSPFFKSMKGGAIQCTLCPRGCKVPEGKRGYCRVRENRGGKYYSLVYGNPCALHLDPIEKKPLFHVLPGTTSLSIATAGCNFQCKFCQNWEISQASPEQVYSYELSPQSVVTRAKEMGARSLAYTYVEPTIFYEYMMDIAVASKKAGLLNIVHSNGFINPDPIRSLSPFLDAANIDLKGFTESFYKELCSGELAPVLDTLKILKEQEVHLEITNLVIPTCNDDMSVIREMCLWIRGELGADTPLHFSRFYPLYKLTKLPPTPIYALEKARETAFSCGLRFVYIGNVPGHAAWNTYCAECGKAVIERTGYMIRAVHLIRGKCEYCGSAVPGIWA